MALRRYHNDTLSFPTPYRQNVYYPNTYRDYRSYPYDARGVDRRARLSRYDYESPRERSGRELLDRGLHLHGDLGWTLDYATAWCYRFLVGNQTEVADAIDKIRDLEVVEEKTPYVIFDHLSKAIFGGKLKDMVFLRWRAQASFACGTTSAPGVVPGIPRICIELNKLPFEDGYGDMEDLLDALIHQMIHAFFLVCCGAQPTHVKTDGRLADGMHFGVILHTIQDISRQCVEGSLGLIFYAAKRRDQRAQSGQQRQLGASGYRRASLSGRNNRPAWISIHPLGSLVPAAPADGQTHCCHDNRSIRPAQVKNWQVEHYARAIELNMDQKGDVIYDLGVDGKLVPTDRLRGPPSSSYIELIWDQRRIMVPREKCIKFESLKKPLEREDKFELKLPECTMAVLKLLYDFLQHRMYWEGFNESMAKSTTHRHQGPPILLVDAYVPVQAGHGLIEHIQVFKTAEAMKFEELQRYALKRLYDMPTTSDDPIEALKELYNEVQDRSRPIHAELHKWARGFLARDEDRTSQYNSYPGYGRQGISRGTSNYEKLIHWYGDRFQELYNSNMAFKDDCKLVNAELSAAGTGRYVEPGAAMDYYSSLLDPQRLLSPPATHSLMPRPRSWNNPQSMLPRARSWSNYNPLDWNFANRSTASLLSGRSFDDAVLNPPGRPLLDWDTQSDRVCFNNYDQGARIEEIC